MPRREPPADPSPGPLDLATPEAVDGVVDLRPVLEAAYDAAGLGFADVDRDEWIVCETWKARRWDVAYRLLADWHGLPLDRHGYFTRTEVVPLVATRTVQIDVHLAGGARGLWVADLSRQMRGTCGGAELVPFTQVAYVDRATAVRAQARHALSYFEGGPKVRIAAALRRHAGLPEPGPVPG